MYIPAKAVSTDFTPCAAASSTSTHRAKLPSPQRFELSTPLLYLMSISSVFLQLRERIHSPSSGGRHNNERVKHATGPRPTAADLGLSDTINSKRSVSADRVTVLSRQRKIQACALLRQHADSSEAIPLARLLAWSRRYHGQPAQKASSSQKTVPAMR